MNRAVAGGALAAATVLALTVGPLVAVAGRADGSAGLGPADWAALRFTLLQATLSALLSVALAVPVARALSRRRFPGRAVLVTLMGAPFILPVIVAVLGLLAVFGRNGLISHALGLFGLPPVNIYGLQGVVLAHVFFNLPLATRLVLQGWQAIPSEHFRLAASLGFHKSDIARVLERPMLKQVLPGAAMVVFVISLTSFAVVLALGGGPRASTIELAIYQAFRFDFDLGKAALLAVLQFSLGAVAVAAMLALRMPDAGTPGHDRPLVLWHGQDGAARLVDALWIMLAGALLVLPLGAIVARGIGGIATMPAPVLAAALRSLAVSLGAVLVGLSLALPIAFGAHALGRRHPVAAGIMEAVGTLAIAASALVIGLGLFIMLQPLGDPLRWVLPVTAVVNGVMSLPFLLRALVPAVARIETRFGRLADSLGLVGWQRLRHLHLPRLRRPLGFSAGLAAALSMGDLGVVALFADGHQATLPLQLYRLMAAYRMEQAAGAALLLLVLALALFWLFDRGGRIGAET